MQRIGSWEQWEAKVKFGCDATNAPNIYFTAVALIEDDFRRSVKAALNVTVHALGAETAAAHVDDDKFAVFIQTEVFRLDIGVNDAAFVHFPNSV